MRVIERTAKTPEEAIELALKELGVDRSEVEIDVVSKGKAGIFGFGSEPARVRVTLLDKPSDAVKTATTVINDLISLMGLSLVASLKQARSEEVGGPVFNIEGDDSGLLIGRRGETLHTFQFLVNFLVSHRLGSRTRVMVDVEGYQERRHRALRNLARRVAQRVEAAGKSITLEPMPPSERRVVHMALANHPRVVTESVGVGPNRRVVVQPRRK